ncbi:hypothetical protein LWI28_026683 [Acer negundo]|uniref:Uncharacterized protein n=1 Tax=Acer negundo TaxID=4023 RepID=A0AAD5I868_ACENE|nr:hypothetical protein LWI28_026683 [Acer negundo]
MPAWLLLRLKVGHSCLQPMGSKSEKVGHLNRIKGQDLSRPTLVHMVELEKLPSETSSSNDGEQQWTVAEDSVDERCSDGDRSDDVDRGATTTVSYVPFSLCSGGD